MVIWILKCSHWWLCHCRRNFTFRLNLYQNANAEWKRDTWEFFFVSFLSGLRKIIGRNGRKSAQTNFRKVQYQLHNKKNVSFPNRFAPPFLFVFIPFSFCVQREKKKRNWKEMVWRVHFKKWNQLQLKCLRWATIEKEAAAAQTKKKHWNETFNQIKKIYMPFVCVCFVVAGALFHPKNGKWQ